MKKVKGIKITPFLIERLKTAEIDNLEEISKEYPTIFNQIFEELKVKRYWTDVIYDTVMLMCAHLKLNNEQVSLNNFSNFFKNPN